MARWLAAGVCVCAGARACVCVPRTVVGRRYMSEQVFYSWHHANAYETASEVVLDVTVYPNPGTMQVVR